MKSGIGLLLLAWVFCPVSYAIAQYTVKWEHPTGNYWFIASGNTDGDSQPELMFASADDNSIILIDGNSGATEWEFTDFYIELGLGNRPLSPIPRTLEAGPQLIDVDSDGLDEIIFWAWDGISPAREVCIDWDFGVGVLPDSASTTSMAESPTLEQNYPNPFNPATVISYSVPQKSHVKLVVYNTIGQAVATLVDEDKAAGDYSVTWDGTGSSDRRLASGVYFYSLQTNEISQSKKMILLK